MTNKVTPELAYVFLKKLVDCKGRASIDWMGNSIKMSNPLLKMRYARKDYLLSES